MYTYHTSLKLHQTDAAGLLFFSRVFELAYDAFHEFMEENDFGLGRIILQESFLLPIVHAEADYILPLHVGDKLEIRITLEKIGRSSVTTGYTILRSGQLAGSMKIIHVAIAKETGAKIAIPESLKKVLQPYLPGGN
jgi:1,4-dihydroxy-2-naphthoyl-CoA hydrolase